MKIKLIDFGVPEGRRPFRPHENDAGADVYMPCVQRSCTTLAGVSPVTVIASEPCS